jgi:hypothetical protein
MVTNFNTVVIYRGILTLDNVGTAVNYCSILYHWHQDVVLHFKLNLGNENLKNKISISVKNLVCYKTLSLIQGILENVQW